MSQRHPRGLSRAGSDGVIKTTSVTRATQRQHSSAEVPRRNLLVKEVVVQNGSHSAVNGANNDRGSVKKSPLLPPPARDRNKTSSDSSISSSNSSGSVFRTVESAAQSSNRDGQLSDSPSSQPKSDGKLINNKMKLCC